MGCAKKEQREKGVIKTYLNNTKNENCEDEDDKEEDESERRGWRKNLSTEDSVKLVEKDLTYHQFCGQL